ncbi:MAG: cytochrome c [Planctomyces sp.]
MQFRTAVIILTMATAAIGCGGGSSGVSTNATAPATASASAPAAPLTTGPATASGAAVPGKTAGHGRAEVWTDDKGVKWLGDIPYDVFFDQPSKIAADETPLATGGGSAPETVSASGTGAAEDRTAATAATNGKSAFPEGPSAGGSPTGEQGSAGSWEDLISADVIDAEMKQLRNTLQENLQSVGSFNASLLSIPARIAAIGTLAGIAAAHSGAISWKEDAGYIRELARQMNEKQLQRGAKDQKRLLGLFESISDILNRSKPADLPAPADNIDFAAVAELRLLMMRMEEAEKRLRTEFGNETAFSRGRPTIQHEASVLAVFSHAAALPEYGYSDDTEFVGYGVAMENAVRKIMEAAESGDFGAYELAVTTVSNTCQECHSKFKNN